VRLAGDRGFWAALIDVDGPAVVRTGVWAVRVGGTDGAMTADLAAAPVFAGEGVGSLYRAGQLGARLVDGGDGTAEETYLSSVGCVSRAFGEATAVVLAGHRADLVVVYLPMTDDLGHELAGWCDAESGAHQPRYASSVWPVLRRGYQLSDAILARVLDRAGPGDTVMLTADHGVVGGTHLVYVNECLIQAGLAVRAADGQLDAARSDVIYHPANNGSVWVHPRHHVPGRFLARAMTVLAGLTGPSGAPIVHGWVDANGRPVRAGDSTAMAYLILRDDYQPMSIVDGDGAVRPATKSGFHTMNTATARLHATFAAAGPDLPAGQNLGLVDNTFPADLAARHLGLSPTGQRPVEFDGAAQPGRRIR
jgi:hypothetical protein